MKKPGLTPLIIFTLLAILFIAPYNLFADDLQMTTYYPAPNGNYQNLIATSATLTNLTATNATVSNDLQVNNNLIVTNEVQPASITTGTLTVNGASLLKGTVTIQDNLTTSKPASFGGQITITPPILGGPFGPLGLLVNGRSDLKDNVAITGFATVSGSLTVNNGATINGAALTAAKGATISGGILNANNGIATTTLSTSGLATLQDLSVIGAMTFATLSVTGNATIGGETRTTSLGVGTVPPHAGMSVDGGNVAIMNNHWINADGTNNHGLSFSPKGRVTINTPPDDAAFGPLFDVQVAADSFSFLSTSTVVMRFGPTIAQSVRAGFQVNGTMGVAGSAAFNGQVKAFDGILLGDTTRSSTKACTSALWGSMGYSCNSASPTTCSLKICTPCNNAGQCVGYSGNVWLPILTTTGPGSGGGIGMIQSDPPID